MNPEDTRDCDGFPGLAPDTKPCTCTRACIPQGITKEQTCREHLCCGDAGDCSGCE